MSRFPDLDDWTDRDSALRDAVSQLRRNLSRASGPADRRSWNIEERKAEHAEAVEGRPEEIRA